MGVQAHVLAVRVVVDVVVGGAVELGVDLGGEAGLGFDGDVGHWLVVDVLVSGKSVFVGGGKNLLRCSWRFRERRSLYCG